MCCFLVHDFAALPACPREETLACSHAERRRATAKMKGGLGMLATVYLFNGPCYKQFCTCADITAVIKKALIAATQ